MELSKLDLYIFENSEEDKELREQFASYAKYFIGIDPVLQSHHMAQLIADKWTEEIRVIIKGLLSNKKVDKLYDDISFISNVLLAWSSGLIKDDLLDEFAKYVIVNQIIGDNSYSLNSIALDKLRLEIQNKKAPNAPKKGDAVRIDTTMFFYDTWLKTGISNISATATKCGRSEKAVREHLKVIVGKNYSNLFEETHPEYKKLSKAYEIWKRKK